LELRAKDLRFSREEAGELLRRMPEIELADGEALVARTEGLAAGLQFAAFGPQGQ
jgi:ATP/maltotriose-dependent transcriptional regulator MalT